MIWQNWFDILFLSVGNTNPTARTGVAVERLLRSKTEGDIVLRGKLKKCKVSELFPFMTFERNIHTHIVCDLWVFDAVSGTFNNISAIS